MFNTSYDNYNIEVDFNDTVKVFNIPFLMANKDSVFILTKNDAILKGRQLIKKQLTDNTQLDIVFDKSIENSSIEKYDFRFFSNNSTAISSMSVDPDSRNIIQIFLNKQVTPGDYISISHFPEKLVSTDGGKATAFDPEPI